MAESSSPTVFESGASNENICPITDSAPNFVVSPKRSRFVRMPLSDITNVFEQRNSSNNDVFVVSSCDDCRMALKRKADCGDCDMNCRSKMLRMSFR